MRRTTLLLLSVALAVAPSAGADGMLDPSFGNGGLVTTNFPIGPFSLDGANSLVVLPDGRAVAAGGTGDPDGLAMAAARYLASGALDTTFSGDGLVVVDCGGWFGAGGAAQAALLQPDGRLVLVGSCPGNQLLTVARLNVDGSLDPSFGTSGQVFTPFPGGVLAAAGLLQPDGRIVAVGRSPFSFVALKAARYNPDGSLDPSFGTGGTLTLSLAQDFVAEDAALQADGKLVIAGTYGPSGGGDFGLVRLLPNGALDPSFDGDGVVTSDFGAVEKGSSVIVLGDGRLVLGGRRAFDLALVRYLPDGSLDTTFGTGGLATANSGVNNGLSQVTLLPNGKLLVAGSLLDSQGYAVDFLLARFHPDGGLDTSFGSSGFIRTDFSAGSRDGCTAVAVAGPDLVLTAGFTSPAPALADFALARYIATTPVELLTFAVE
jgi:uncharacterized delta-60 repeat protein